MIVKRKAKKKGSRRDFYSRALDEAEKLELEEASHIEGIDEEIALLRVKLRELLEEQPERIDLHFEAANIIARLVKTRYQITKEQKKSLKEAIQKVLTEVAVPLGVGVGGKILSTKL
jgi:DNA-binding transcriptional regulator GbsR (MarR family)